MNALGKLGLVIVVVGAIVLAGPVFGFSTIAADRGVSVTTSDDSTALVGINATGETPDNQNDAVVVEITNNADEEYSSLETNVSIEDTNGALAISSGFATTLSAGETTGLELTCDGGGDGTATVSVNADAFGSTLQVQGVSYSTTFSYSCTGGGNSNNANFEVRSVEFGGDTDEIEVTLENTGQDRAKVKGISIDGTTSNATEVENNGNGNPSPVVVGGSDVGANIVSINGETYDLQGNTKVDPGDTVVVGIYGFQDDAADPVSVAGEDVTVSLYSSNQRIDQITVSVPE